MRELNETNTKASKQTDKQTKQKHQQQQIKLTQMLQNSITRRHGSLEQIIVA